MRWEIASIFLLSVLLNYFLIVTVADILLMGACSLRFVKSCAIEKYLITKENRFAFQTGLMCSAFSSAYLLRHYDIEASGETLYTIIPNKMKEGYVYPKGIKKLLSSYGFQVKYHLGNINALKAEVAKGSPVIVLIRVRTDKNWLHYVPVVGYDEEYIYIAESMSSLVNCNEEYYNRKLTNQEFLRYWDTREFYMPFYKNTYLVITSYNS